MAIQRSLKTLLRASQFSWLGFLTLFLTVFGAIWLMIEPFGFFKVFEDTADHLGIWGYVALLAISLLVAGLSLAIRTLINLRRFAHAVEPYIDLLPTYIQSAVDESDATDVVLEDFFRQVPPRGDTFILLEDMHKDKDPVSVSRRMHVNKTLLRLFQRLGLLKIEGNQVRPVSELSSCLLKSIGLHLVEKLTLIGNWDKEGTENPDARMTRDLVRIIEEQRCARLGITAALPCRKVCSSLGIIKGHDVNGPVYLLQKSDAWGLPYYWFIGGVVESTDNDFATCMIREAMEELTLQRPSIRSVSELTEVRDKRISGRLGGLTEYTYKIFLLQLDCNAPDTQKLLSKSFSHETFHGFSKVVRHNKWFTRAEIIADVNLRRDAGPILDAIEKLPLDTLAPSLGPLIA